MVADGRDTPFGSVEERAWLTFVRTFVSRLSLDPGSSVFDVGCGAGAFLYDLHRSGYAVAGLDRSSTLIACARLAMPGSSFEIADAADLPATPGFDAVVSCDVFPYFSSLEYAELVIDRMVAKARRAVAVIGVPDAAKKTEALARREELAGGAEAYAARYRGLEHLYIEREWLMDRLARRGLTDIEVEGQEISGYDNGAYRFNCWGFLPDQP